MINLMTDKPHNIEMLEIIRKNNLEAINKSELAQDIMRLIKE